LSDIEYAIVSTHTRVRHEHAHIHAHTGLLVVVD